MDLTDMHDILNESLGSSKEDTSTNIQAAGMIVKHIKEQVEGTTNTSKVDFNKYKYNYNGMTESNDKIDDAQDLKKKQITTEEDKTEIGDTTSVESFDFAPIEHYENINPAASKSLSTQLLLENYNLTINSGNMINSYGFPPKEDLIKNYMSFGSQAILEFIFRYDSKFPNIIAFLIESFQQVQRIIDDQYQYIFDFLFPASLENANKPLQQEIINHLQSNYKQIMSLEAWCQKNSITFSPPTPGPSLNHSPSLAHPSEFMPTIHAMHDIFWQIKLTHGFQLASIETFSSSHYTFPFDAGKPTIVFPPLMFNNSLVVKGFAY